MISANISKLKLFLSGVFVRLDENIDYFNDITVLFKSGTRDYLLKITYKDEKFSSDYLGVKNEIPKEKLLDFICEECKKYDSAVIQYSDRINLLQITADAKGVQTKIKDSVKSEMASSNATVGGREYIIKENEARDLLKAIGILSSDNKVKNDMVRKYNQIDRFVELISDIDMNENLTIMDCACGKSYLSFVLNYYYTQLRKNKCRVYGIDYNESVIESSKAMAKSLNYQNMEFIKADLTQFHLNKKVDMVVSLHACDTATDYALYSGIKHQAKAIICVPCCHKELSHQIEYEPFSAILKHGIFKRRFCDVLTDALRVLLLESYGYKVSVLEYTSPLDTPKNIMLKAIKAGKENEKAKSEYENLKRQFQVNPTLENLLTRS